MSIPVDEIKQALNDLGLEAPKVSTTRLPGNLVTVHISARCRPDAIPPRVHTVKLTPVADEQPAQMVPQPAENQVAVGADLDLPSGGDDLTVIPGIGKATAAKLRAAGYNSFQSLANATEAELSVFVNQSAIDSIHAWRS